MKTRMLWCVPLAGLALLAAGCEPVAPVQPQPARPVGPSPNELAQGRRIEQLTGENQQLQAELQQSRSEHTVALSRARAAEDVARSKAGQSSTAAKLADDSIRRLRGENDQQRSQITTLRGQIADLRKQLGESTQGAGAMQSELATARGDLKTVQTARAEQTQRADLAEAKLTQLEKYAADLRQQVIKRDRTITEMELKAGGKAGYKPEPPPVWPAKPEPGKMPVSAAAFEAKARLTVVSGDTGRIDAGAALGVAKGMRLAVYRGEKFVAYFQVAEARTDSAGGFLVQQKLTPQVGDTVMAPPK